MGSNLKDHKETQTAVAEVVHFGSQLVLPGDPRDMTIDEAINLLERRKKYMTEVVQVARSFNVFPWDGAVALETVLANRYGWAPGVPTPGFFGPEPPKMIDVEIDAKGTKRSVPWGKFKLPNIEGAVSCGLTRENGRFVFQLTAAVTRQYEAEIKLLYDAVDAELKTNSLYRGKAVRVRFLDNDGDMLAIPQIGFIDTEIDAGMLVYNKDLEASIDTNLFTPIRQHNDLAINGLQFKRGVLLGGPFGTGKTLAAKAASKLAVEAGITYIYVPRADELAHAIEFAKQYQSPAAVVFCEDIDRALKGDRTIAVDDILNIIDGVDSKNQRIMIVLTTNDLHAITKAMLRPGRLDAVLEIGPPDAEAVQRLLRVYGKEMIDPAADLSAVGEQLDGQIPATIAEVVKRAKLSQMRFQPPGVPVTTLSPAALLDSARTMTAQLGLLNDTPAAKAPEPLHVVLSTSAMAPKTGKQREDGTTARVEDIIHDAVAAAGTVPSATQRAALQ